MNVFRIFMLIKTSHPDASLSLVCAWSRKVDFVLNGQRFKAEERKCLRDYLDGRRFHRILTGQRDQLNWYLYGINHGVYVADSVTRYSHS